MSGHGHVGQVEAEDQIADLTHQIDKERAALLSETLRLKDIIKGMRAGLDHAHSACAQYQKEAEDLRRAMDEGERHHMREYNQIARRCDGLMRDLAACRDELSRERADSDNKATKTIAWAEECRTALAGLRDVSAKTLAYAAVVEQQRDACRAELATAIQQRMDAERQVADLRQKLDLLTAGPK